MTIKKSIQLIVIISILAIIFMSLKLEAPKTKVKYISIETLMKMKKLNVEIKGLGGYQKDCIQFDIENTSADTLFYKIEAGRRLLSVDSTIQDIFLVKQNNLFLMPFHKDVIKGYGFCCQSSNHAPYENAVFKIGKMAPSGWVKLAQAIDTSKFSPSSIQSAVWSLSNNHPVASITGEDKKAIKQLRKIVATAKRVAMPWYSITYEADTARLFSGKPEHIFGKIDYYLRANAIITITLKYKNKLIKTLVKESPTGRGGYSYTADFDVRGWPLGEYEILIHEDYSKLNKKKTFVLR